MLNLIQKQATVDDIFLFKLSWPSYACAGNTDVVRMVIKGEHCVPFLYHHPSFPQYNITFFMLREGWHRDWKDFKHVETL